jgi:hypothetical protein
MIMQRKDGLYVLPLAFLGSDAGSSLIHRVGDELVYDSKSLCFI